MKRAIVIHPFLFAIYPIIFLYAHSNETHTISVSDLFLPVLAAVAFALLAFSGLSVVFGSIYKGAVAGSLFLVLFFSYGHLFNLVKGLSVAGVLVGRHRFLLLAYGLVLASAFWAIVRTRRSLLDLSRILNVVAGFLVVVTLIQGGANALGGEGLPPLETEGGGGERASSVGRVRPGKRPDIYYIILDTYPSEGVLNEYLEYDNQEFIDFLKDRGFYVASESRSNYALSLLSLASSLNMEYLDGLAYRLGEESQDYRTAAHASRIAT